MANTNHNTMEYTPVEAADIVGRSPALVRMYCNEDKIEHKKFGRTYVITATGLKQLEEIIKNSKPGPKGPRKKKSPGRAKTV